MAWIIRAPAHGQQIDYAGLGLYVLPYRRVSNDLTIWLAKLTCFKLSAETDPRCAYWSASASSECRSGSKPTKNSHLAAKW